jgi:hypothetical protein
VRREVIPFGVSQIDGGTRIGVGAYQQSQRANALPDQEQFSIGDDRPLDQIVQERRTIQERGIQPDSTPMVRQIRAGSESHE